MPSRNFRKSDINQSAATGKEFPAWAVSISGDYITTLTFIDREAYDNWRATELPKLRKKYNNLVLGTPRQLPSIKVGDIVNVVGEGTEEFEVLSITKESETMYRVTVKGIPDGHMWWEPAHKILALED